jgi:hypothetical protein
MTSSPTTVWKVRIPQELAVQVELLCLDPGTGKPRYGARSLLVSNLLQRYVREKGFDLRSPPLDDDTIGEIIT